jgi:hypothetical protein
MPNDKDIFLAFELHDYWFQSYYYVAVRFATSITVIELVFVAIREIIRVCLLSQVQLLRIEERKLIPRFLHTSYHRTRLHLAHPATSKLVSCTGDPLLSE